MSLEFTFCETTERNRWHIRELTSAGPTYRVKPSEPEPDTKTLCGATAAWDINCAITMAEQLEVLEGDAKARHFCLKCEAAFLDRSEA
jgi:hypothetical protein